VAVIVTVEGWPIAIVVGFAEQPTNGPSDCLTVKGALSVAVPGNNQFAPLRKETTFLDPPEFLRLQQENYALLIEGNEKVKLQKSRAGFKIA
jgi:hypothetical protein